MVYETLFRLAYRHANWQNLAWVGILTLIIHFSIWLLAPKIFEVLEALAPAKSQKIELVKSIDLPEELLPEDFRKPQFVPANANSANAMPPENTKNVAANDQRAAQENPDINSRERRPTLDGEIEKSNAVTENVLPREFLPAQNLRLQRARTGAGTASQIQNRKIQNANERLVAEEIKVRANDAGTVAIGEEKSIIEGVPEPSATPIVVPAAGIKTLLMKSNTAANEIGSISLDARYSEFGEYTQRMLETIQASWYKICQNTMIAERGRVIVQFTLRNDGVIVNSKIIESTVGEAAAYACRDAIESRAPFEPWSQAMIDTLGNEDTTTITFYYR